jgi:hypothetical protein
MALFLRIFQHLLPRTEVWKLWFSSMLRKFVEGILSAPADVKTFTDNVFLDVFPDTTREIEAWRTQFGLADGPDEASNRLQLTSAWQATGGQSPRYLQDVVRAAGFDVYIHEWWQMPATLPRVARDPRTYTNVPRIGTNQCSALPNPVRCRAGVTARRCNRFLANEIHYLVNKDLTNNAPPPVPDDPAKWRYFLYWGGASFPGHASVPAERRAEFERLLLKLRPAQQWLVTLIDYEVSDTLLVDEFGDVLVDESGNELTP